MPNERRISARVQKRACSPLRRALALMLCVLFIGTAQAATERVPRVALVTFGAGQLYWELFGHDAILVDDPTADERTVYNYGVFDFEQKNFLLNFARGYMQYRLLGEPLESDLERYAAEGRSVTVQMLN